MWGLTQGGSNGLIEPANPPSTGVPQPAAPGAVSFLATAGTGGDERLYELTQQVDCDTGCGRSLWSTDDAGRTHLHDFTADQDVYAVFMDGEGTAGLAFGSGETRVLRTADGGRSWTPVAQVFAPYGFPPDVVFLDGSIYLYTVQWSGGPAEDDSQHLWRSSVDSEDWTEVALPAAADRGFVYPSTALPVRLCSSCSPTLTPRATRSDGPSTARPGIRSPPPCRATPASSSCPVPPPSSTCGAPLRGAECRSSGSVALEPVQQPRAPLSRAVSSIRISWVRSP